MNFKTDSARRNTVYLTDKAIFYAHILCKAKMNGTDGEMKHDQLIDAEIIDKWEREFPQLVEAYERNTELKQQNKKSLRASRKRNPGSNKSSTRRGSFG